MSADDIAAYAEPDLTEFQNPQIPAALKKPEIPQPDYLGDAMKAEFSCNNFRFNFKEV